MSNKRVFHLLVAAATTAATTKAFIVPASRYISQPKTAISHRRIEKAWPVKSSSKPVSTERKTAIDDAANDDDTMVKGRIESFDLEELKSNIVSKVDAFDLFRLQKETPQKLPDPTPLEHPLLVAPQEEEDSAQIGIWAARALLLGVAMLWGTNFAAVKYLETLCFHPPCNHLPSEAALARFGVAALVSIPLLINQRKDVIFAGLECGFWITFGYISQAMALQTIGAGKCAFICSLTVVVVPLLSALLFGKEIKPVHIVSAAIALSGVGVLEGLVDVDTFLGIQPAVATSIASLPAELASSSTHTAIAASESVKWFGLGKGDLLALGQPFGFGLAFMRIEHYVEKFKHVKNRIITISAAQCVIVGVLSLMWVLYDFSGTLPSFDYMMDPHRLAAVGWTGIMTTVVAIYLEGVALQTASATEAALTFSSEPVWASLFGAWLLHERLNTNAYVGGAIILTACITGALADLPTAESSDAIEVDAESD